MPGKAAVIRSIRKPEYHYVDARFEGERFNGTVELTVSPQWFLCNLEDGFFV